MKRGISLVALIITIIVLVILTGTVIMNAINIPSNANLTVFKTNVGSIQDAVTIKMLNNLTENAANYNENAKWIGVVEGYTIDDIASAPVFDKQINGVNVAALDVSLKDSLSITDEEFVKYYVSENGTIYHEGFDNDGDIYYNQDSKEIIYPIHNVDELLAFAKIVNGTAEGVQKDTFLGKKVVLKSDIDLTNVDWTPIGSSMYDHLPTDPTTKMFEGSFDGENHIIKGLSTGTYVPSSDDVSSSEYSFGLFGYVYGADIKNVKLEQVNITGCEKTVNGNTTYGAGVAALVGYYVPKSGKESVIENCHVLSGNVTATNNMGGLIGYMRADGANNLDVTIKNCSNAASVTSKARDGGGIVGLMNVANADDTGYIRIKNCTNTGNITVESGGSSSCAAGIVGSDNSHNSRKNVIVSIENCINSGNIVSEGVTNGETHAAGIACTYYSSGSWMITKNCTNNGNVTISGGASDNYAGGILSYCQIRTMSGCYNNGIVTLPNTNAIRVTYDCNGADDGLTTTYIDTTVGTEITLSNNDILTKEGYTFAGWNTKADGSGTHYDDGSKASFTNSLILYAQWSTNN